MVYFYSDPGQDHMRSRIENQDCCLWSETANCTAIVLTDGAGTCQYAAEGAQYAANALLSLLLEQSEHCFLADEKELTSMIFESVLDAQKQLASSMKTDLTELSSTYAALLYDQSRQQVMCISLGDSIILQTGTNRSRGIISAPSSSRYGTPVSTTEQGFQDISIERFNVRGDESFAICSDGAWSMMYSRNRMKAEFRASLENDDFAGLHERLQNERPEDDCSFIAISLKDLQKSGLSRNSLKRQDKDSLVSLLVMNQVRQRMEHCLD